MKTEHTISKRQVIDYLMHRGYADNWFEGEALLPKHNDEVTHLVPTRLQIALGVLNPEKIIRANELDFQIVPNA